jgi:hypothetical protein
MTIWQYINFWLGRPMTDLIVTFFGQPILGIFIAFSIKNLFGVSKTKTKNLKR